MDYNSTLLISQWSLVGAVFFDKLSSLTVIEAKPPRTVISHQSLVLSLTIWLVNFSGVKFGVYQ